MGLNMEDTWNSSWGGRLYNQLAMLGYGRLRDLLDAYPGESYLTVGEHIAPWVAGMQIQRMQMDEARRDRGLRHAAADSITREICEAMPAGWQSSATNDSLLAAALGRWVATLEVCGGIAEASNIAMEFAQAIRKAPPPAGWRPVGPCDPILQSLFDKCWPHELT